MSRYVLFVLDLGRATQRIVEGRVAFAPDPAIQPDTAFEWRIVHDVTGKVCIWERHDRRVDLIATAQYTDRLANLRQLAPATPSEWQWAIVEESLKAALARAVNAVPPIDGREPAELPSHALVGDGGFDRSLANLEHAMSQTTTATRPRRKWRLWHVVSGIGSVVGFIIVSVLEIADCASGTSRRDKSTTTRVSPALTTTRPKSRTHVADAAPIPATLAEAITASRPTSLDDDLGDPLVHYAAAKLRWADIATADTSLLKADKDPAAEHGKRLCASGTLTEITRRDVDKHKVFVGRLDTADGDPVWFVAVGSSGELVKRSAATVCGVVAARTHGMVGIVGMFDLPENRSPSVEQ